MPCETALISSRGPTSKADPGGGITVNRPAAGSLTPLLERDPISTRVVRQGPHGLQLVIQLDNNAPPRTEPIRTKRGRNDSKLHQTSQQPDDYNDDRNNPIGEQADANPSGSKRLKSTRTLSASSLNATITSTSDDDTENKEFDHDHIRSVTSYSDRINRYFEQIEDADSWSDSSQTILVVLGDVMRHVQTFGLPDPSNAEHSALHEEIRHEVAQIEHLVHDYTENMRRKKTTDPIDIP